MLTRAFKSKMSVNVMILGYDLYGMYTGGGNIGHSGHLAGAFIGSSYFLFRRLRRLL